MGLGASQPQGGGGPNDLHARHRSGTPLLNCLPPLGVQVVNGDTLVIMAGSPNPDPLKPPPAEKRLTLSSLVAPRLVREALLHAELPAVPQATSWRPCVTQPDSFTVCHAGPPRWQHS